MQKEPLTNFIQNNLPIQEFRITKKPLKQK